MYSILKRSQATLETEIHKQLVLEALKKGIENAKDLQHLKNAYCLKYKIPSASNVELIHAYRQLMEEGRVGRDDQFAKLIRKRGVRSLSGIANITVLTKAFPCPGKCIFCPTEPGMPKSYLSEEPAMMRAILNDFSAEKQVRNRLASLNKTGHSTDKIDMIVAGGTFSFYPKRYQNDFIRGLYNALNHPLPRERSFRKAQDINEKALNRCIGLSVETRPDHIDKQELKRLRNMGVTKIEVGVQSLDDEVLSLNDRGHGVDEVKRAFKLMRDAGFKINAHMMPNLHGSTPAKDLRDMRELFENPEFRPDWIKVYPCMVVPWSRLEQIHKKGDYKSYSDQELVDLMVEMTPLFPRYVRVTRMYRDIPANIIISGSKQANLRQVVESELVKKGIKSHDIRSREIRDESVQIDDLEMNIDEFEASGGKEFFISFDEPIRDKICALLRLRFPSQHYEGKPHFIPELEGAALIREIHTYGEQVKINQSQKSASQHIGLGSRMIEKAENLAKFEGLRKIAVISGIGVREYYRKKGYQLEGTYMVKYL